MVWGGVNLAGVQELSDGAAYDPAADRWRRMASSPLAGRYASAHAWTGQELVVWGGNTLGSRVLADGAAYDPAADRWRTLPSAPVPERSAAGFTWTGRELLVWGGVGRPGAAGEDPLTRVLQPRTTLTLLEDGAAYDPATDRWRTLEPVQLLGRGFPVTVWTDREMILWGGLVAVSSPASASDGVRYRP